jgi:hypothetical protein
MNANRATRSKGKVSYQTTGKWPTLEEAKEFKVKVNRNLNPKPFSTSNNSSVMVSNNGLNKVIMWGELRKRGAQLGRELKNAYDKGDIEAIDRITEEAFAQHKILQNLSKQMILPMNTINENNRNTLKMNFRGGRRTRRNRK